MPTRRPQDTEWAGRLILKDLLGDPKRLLEIATRLQAEYLRAMAELDRLSERETRSEVDRRGEETAATAAPWKRRSLPERPQQRWVRADIDFPNVKAEHGLIFNGHHMQDAVVFNAGTKVLTVQRIKDLQGNFAVYSRLPSRVSRTIYVWIESITDPSAAPVPHYRVTDKDETPEGSMYHLTIHLDRLHMTEKLRILTGQIRWLFILKTGRLGTGSSSETAESH